MLLSLLRLIPVWAWALLVCAAVIAFQSWRIDANDAELSAVQGQRTAATAKADSLQATLKLQRALYSEASQIDTDTAKELADARQANHELRADLAAGRKRVSVNATCVRDAGTTGSADAGTPRLTPDAEQARADLELGNEEHMVQIRGLQRFIREVCLKNGKAE